MAKKKKRIYEKLSTKTEVEAHRKPRINHRKLGRERNWGEQWCGTSQIYLDPRMKARKYLEVLVHEMLHLYFPGLNERTVRHLGKSFCYEIWKRRYRRLEK